MKITYLKNAQAGSGKLY